MASLWLSDKRAAAVGKFSSKKAISTNVSCANGTDVNQFIVRSTCE